MFRKLLIVSIIGLISSFVYAEKQVVTADMLIGKWKCKVSEFKSNDDNNNQKIVYQTYKKENNELVVYVKKDNSVNEDRIVFPNINNISNYKYDGKCKGRDTWWCKISTGFNYVSDDEYERVQSIKIDQKYLADKGKFEIELYSKAVCTRVK